MLRTLLGAILGGLAGFVLAVAFMPGCYYEHLIPGLILSCVVGGLLGFRRKAGK